MLLRRQRRLPQRLRKRHRRRPPRPRLWQRPTYSGSAWASLSSACCCAGTARHPPAWYGRLAPSLAITIHLLMQTSVPEAAVLLSSAVRALSPYYTAVSGAANGPVVVSRELAEQVPAPAASQPSSAPVAAPAEEATVLPRFDVFLANTMNRIAAGGGSRRQPKVD